MCRDGNFPVVNIVQNSFGNKAGPGLIGSALAAAHWMCLMASTGSSVCRNAAVSETEFWA